jgi:hypothetical protein
MGYTPPVFLKSVEGVCFEGDANLPFSGVCKSKRGKELRRGVDVNVVRSTGWKRVEKRFTGHGSMNCVLCQYYLACCYSNGRVTAEASRRMFDGMARTCADVVTAAARLGLNPAIWEAIAATGWRS